MPVLEYIRTISKEDPYKLVFVCLGNICRSPTAEGVFIHKVRQRGLESFFYIDSAGTAAYHVPIIGGTKNPDIDKIRVLSPDFVIANKEENRKEDIEQIESFTKVMVTDISTINKALYWIQKIGSTLEVRDRTITLIDRVNNELLNTPAYRPIPTAYFIWREPWMTIGKDTYIHDHRKSPGIYSPIDQREVLHRLQSAQHQIVNKLQTVSFCYGINFVKRSHNTFN